MHHENSDLDAADVRPSDIVFDCPYCSKSLAIDCRGAGLTIACPDCDNKVQVPIPEGMEISDIDSSDQEKEVRIIHMREIIATSQARIMDLESEIKDLTLRREALEKLRTENALRFDVIGREMEAVQRSLLRISEVLTSASDAVSKG
jgi:transcription elongation factor Elf1